MTIQVRLLGELQLLDTSGGAVEDPPRKAWALLAYLAMTQSGSVPRDMLSSLLWPKSYEGQGRASLRQELSVLKRSLAEAEIDFISASKDSVSLKLPDAVLDVAQFEQDIRSENWDTLRQAVGLYRGDFLGRLKIRSGPFEEWVWIERQRLRSRFIRGANRLLKHDICSGDRARILATAEGLRAIDPYQETAVRAAMDICRLEGDFAGGLRLYNELEIALRREMQSVPSLETRVLADDIKKDVTRNMSVAQPLRRSSVFVVHVSLAITEDVAIGVEPEDVLQAQNALAERVSALVTKAGGAAITSAPDRLLAVFEAEGDTARQAAELAHSAAHAIVKEPCALSKNLHVWPRAGLSFGVALLSPHPPLMTLVGACVQRAAETGLGAAPGEVAVDRGLRALGCSEARDATSGAKRGGPGPSAVTMS